jgi:hypothetical protein
MFNSGASHMCMVHNSILRGYNSIYHQAPHVTEANRPAFLGYCLAWHKFPKTHTENEDNSLFVNMEDLLGDKTIFDESHREHGESDSRYGSLREIKQQPQILSTLA